MRSFAHTLRRSVWVAKFSISILLRQRKLLQGAFGQSVTDYPRDYNAPERSHCVELSLNKGVVVGETGGARGEGHHYCTANGLQYIRDCCALFECGSSHLGLNIAITYGAYSCRDIQPIPYLWMGPRCR